MSTGTGRPRARTWFRSIPVGRLLGFIGLPLISAVAPFLVLPVLLRFVGPEAWSAVAIGQSIGTGVSTLVLLGWPVVGPSAVAADPGRRRELYTEGLVSRAAVLVLAAPSSAVAAAALSPSGHGGEGALMALASVMLGMAPTWFFVGLGRPGAIAAYDTIPRVAATAAAAVVVGMTGRAWVYPAALLTTSLVGVVLVSARYGQRPPRHPLHLVRRVVRQQWSTAGVSVQSALYTSLPITLVAVAAPAAVPVFAALDRVLRFPLFVLGPVGLAFQGWVSEVGAEAAGRRRTALVVTLAAGGVLAIGFVGTAGWLVDLLFAGRLTVPFAAFVVSGVGIVAIAATTTLGYHYLVPLGRHGWLIGSTTAGAAVGAPAILWGAAHFGTTGAATGIAAAEVAVAAVQVIALLRHRRSRP